jgi:hypothetical protein
VLEAPSSLDNEFTNSTEDRDDFYGSIIVNSGSTSGCSHNDTSRTSLSQTADNNDLNHHEPDPNIAELDLHDAELDLSHDEFDLSEYELYFDTLDEDEQYVQDLVKDNGLYTETELAVVELLVLPNEQETEYDEETSGQAISIVTNAAVAARSQGDIEANYLSSSDMCPCFSNLSLSLLSSLS